MANKRTKRQSTKRSAAGNEPGAVTIGECLHYLAPGILDAKRAPLWPPDAFAMAMTLLHKSGAYNYVLRRWPPVAAGRGTKAKQAPASWGERMRNIGLAWRQACVRENAPPSEVEEWWRRTIAFRDSPLHQIQGNPKLCEALLQLCAVADEASAHAGIPTSRKWAGHSATIDPFEVEAHLALRPQTPGGSTLCKEIHYSRVRVLPKLHTPQNGHTTRSLSHYLALCMGDEIQPNWHRLPYSPEGNSLNLLLVPWPEVVRPSQFQPIRRQYEQIRPGVLQQLAFLISGVADASPGVERPGANCFHFDIPVSDEHYVSLRQDKHHRWRLDKSQVIQYGLGGSLDPESSWWEHIPVGNRSLAFVAARPWLTISVLICEDLARPDPVGDLVRAVGPNLVVALLMDAPQLASRWPGRYATVLADDPGCSVLTITSIGMAELSRPPNVARRPRVIALWKDAKSGTPVEIELPPAAGGIVLNLTAHYLEEWTADGRSDHCTTGYPILAGVHPVGGGII